MPSLNTPENTPVIFVGTQGDVKVKDANGKEIKLKKGDKIPAGASISVGPQGGKIVFKQADQTLKFENSGEVSLTNALMQASDASQADVDSTEPDKTAEQITTTPAETTTQPTQQPLSRPTGKAEAAPAPTPAKQGISEAPEVVKAERGEEPQQTATEVVAQMAETLVANSARVAAPIAEIQTQTPQAAEDTTVVEEEAQLPPPPPPALPDDKPTEPELPKAPSIASFSPDTGVADDQITSEKTLAITGSAQPDTSVTLLCDDQPVVKDIAVNSEGAWTSELTVENDGSYKLTAVASNQGGSSQPSEPFNVTVNSAPPELAFDNLVPDSTQQFNAFSKSGTVSGTASPLLAFQLKAGEKTYDVTADKEGRWSQEITDLTDGTLPLSASAQSIAGVSITQNAEMLVRTAPYDIKIIPDTGASNTDYVTKHDFIYIHVHGQPGAKLSVKLGDEPTFEDFDENGLANFAMMLSESTTYPFEFRTIYKDDAGESEAVSIDVVLNMDKPVITPDDHGTSFNTPDLPFSGESNEEKVTLTLKLVNKADNNAVFEGKTDVVDGKYAFDAKVPTDGTYTATPGSR